MIPTAPQRDKTAGWTFSLSLLLHLIMLFIFNNTALFRTALHESTPYYVDIVSLPDPAPARGEPVSAPTPPLPAVMPPAPAQKPAMSLPAKQLPPTPANSAATADQERRAQEAREFSERMSRLERDSGAKHQAEALASLQKKAAEKRAAGATPAAGIGKGADYGTHIQSRLKDALSRNIAYDYRSKNPEAAVHLYIDKNGKLTKYVMEHPSTDKLFNNSVIRTIESAKAYFPPVPLGVNFDKLYVFSPQEVKK